MAAGDSATDARRGRLHWLTGLVRLAEKEARRTPNVTSALDRRINAAAQERRGRILADLAAGISDHWLVRSWGADRCGWRGNHIVRRRGRLGQKGQRSAHRGRSMQATMMSRSRNGRPEGWWRLSNIRCRGRHGERQRSAYGGWRDQGGIARARLSGKWQRSAGWRHRLQGLGHGSDIGSREGHRRWHRHR